MKVKSLSILSALALVAAVSSVRADVTLMSDSLTGTGALAGSAPTVGSANWSTFYANNGGEVVPAYQTDSTGAGFTAATTGITPVDASRSGSGTNVGAFTSHTDDGGIIAITPAASGAITANGTFSFPNIATSGNPTAWAFIALTNSLSSPDVVSGSSTAIAAWLLVRPASNGTDVVELYASEGTGKQATTTNTEVGTGTHTMQLIVDPVAGTLDASVDGNVLLSTPYSYASHSIALPTIDGFMFGNRTNTGQPTASNPSTTILSNVSVTQATPEPASLGVLAIGAAGLLARRRR